MARGRRATFGSESEFREKWQDRLRPVLAPYSRFRPSNSQGRELIERAFWFAAKAHEGQKRDEGSDYFTHPVAAAVKASRAGADAETIAATLLHDVTEDCAVPYSRLERRFGARVAKIVDLVSKPKLVAGRWVFSYEPGYSSAEDEYDRLKTAKLREERLDAFYQRLHNSGNGRALFVKLFDNLHNMQTIRGVPESKRRTNILASLKYNKWIAAQIHPRLHAEFDAAIRRGLRSLEWPDERIAASLAKYAPKHDVCPVGRVIATPRLFDLEYFLKFDPGKHQDALLVYHATKTGERFVRVPRTPGTSALAGDKSDIERQLGLLRSHGLDVRPVVHVYPRRYRHAFLFKLRPALDQLSNEEVCRRLDEIEAKHFPRQAQA